MSRDPGVSDLQARLAVALSERYRIERELGQGGMATVFLAEDLRHDRKVAIKVLHPELSAVIGGARFLAEIKLTAQLQHPHILGLIDSGHADGLLYYVMPYVSGESLRARLQRDKLLPVEEALRLTREVAGALDFAHRQGVVHRDIKPENILLQDGGALVADFGIALAVQQAGGSRMTETGISLGTPAYMSPEQAMGERDLTARSDVYALGCVLYEMLAGEPPFTGPSAQAIVARLLTEPPRALGAQRATVPPHVQAAVATALQKLPADRFATAKEFADALARRDTTVVHAAPRPGAVGASRDRSWSRVAAGLLAGLLLLATGWALGRRSRAPEGAWSSFTQLTDASGVETSPSLSPDGESFAYATNARGSWDIYAQRVGGRNPVLVAGDSTLDELWPAYSPDGRQVAYALGGGGIFVVGATGESPHRLTNFGSNPAWSPDGRRIVFGSEEVVTPYNVNANGALWIIDLDGAQPRRLDTRGKNDTYQPAWSPSGARIAFWSSTQGQRDIETIPADGGPRQKITDDPWVDWAPAWSPDGRYLYFSSDRGGTMGIWRVAIDERSGRTTGPLEPVAAGVDVAMDLPCLSRSGDVLLFRSQLESVNPAAIPFDPTSGRTGPVQLLQHRTGILVPNDVSPDGRWLALNNFPGPQQDIFVMHPDGTGLTRLMEDEARDFFPAFTPDGQALTFFSNSGGEYQGWSIRLDGSGRTRLTDVNGGAIFSSFAPDGKRLAVQNLRGGARIGAGPWPVTDASLDSVAGLVLPEGRLAVTRWSRDGRLLTGYMQGASAEPHGYGILELATGRARRLNDDSRGYYFAWLPGGREIVYFTESGELVRQDVTTLARRRIAVALPYPPDYFGSIAASPDGRTLYYGARQAEANIWLVKRAGAVPAEPGR